MDMERIWSFDYFPNNTRFGLLIASFVINNIEGIILQPAAILQEWFGTDSLCLTASILQEWFGTESLGLITSPA